MRPCGLLRGEFLISPFLRLRSPGRAVEYLVNPVDIVHAGVISHYKMIAHSGPLCTDAAPLIGVRSSAAMTLVVSFLAFKFQSDIQEHRLVLSPLRGFRHSPHDCGIHPKALPSQLCLALTLLQSRPGARPRHRVFASSDNRRIFEHLPTGWRRVPCDSRRRKRRMTDEPCRVAIGRAEV